MRPSAAKQEGFTLLELLVSMAILAFMMMVAWTTLSNTASAKTQVEEINDRYHELRLGMARMVRDLSHAYISANEDQNLQNRRTMFIGEQGGDVGSLRFSSMSHYTLWADANESEQTLVSYSAERDREDGSLTNLIRRESRRLSNENWQEEPAEVEALVRGIKKVRFEYFDWKDSDWHERWDSTKADAERGRLPVRVRITMEIETKSGNEIVLTTQARIMMQEELRFFAN